MGSPYPFPFLFCKMKDKWIYLHIGDVVVNNPPANAGDRGSIPGLGRSPGVENGNQLHYSCLENSMDIGAWWAIEHGVAKSQIQLSY